MNWEISNFMEKSSLFSDTNKKIELGKHKNFSDTLKSYDKTNKEKDELQENYGNEIHNKDNTKVSKEKNLENKKHTENLKKETENKEEKIKNKNHKDNYNLFFNIFPSISESDEILLSEEEIVEVVDLESLSGENLDASIFEEEKILDILSKLDLIEDGREEKLTDEETLEKSLIENLNVDTKSLESKESQVDEGQVEKYNKENTVNLKTLKSNEKLVLDDNEEVVLEGEDNEILLLESEKPSKEEANKDLNKENDSKNFNLEETLEKEPKVKSGVDNKSSFTFEKQNIKFRGSDHLHVEDQEPIDKKQFMEHIVEKVKFDLGNNKNQIKMTLKPESLGEMMMEVEVIKNSLVAKVMVDNQRAKEIIENNLLQLKEGVKDTGLEIKTFEVFVGNNSDFDKHNPDGFNFNKRNEKLKIKGKDKDKNDRIELYEDSIQTNEVNTLDLYSESSLNLLA